jgi:hypothetical protein
VPPGLLGVAGRKLHLDRFPSTMAQRTDIETCSELASVLGPRAWTTYDINKVSFTHRRLERDACLTGLLSSQHYPKQYGKIFYFPSGETLKSFPDVILRSPYREHFETDGTRYWVKPSSPMHPNKATSVPTPSKVCGY